MNRTTRAFLFTTLAAAAAAQDSPKLSLRQTLELAEKKSPDVQLAVLRRVEAQARSLLARSAYQPQVGIAVGNTYQTSNMEGIGLLIPGIPSRLGPYRVFNARPQLTAPVFDLELLSGIHAARERVVESKYDAETARQATLLAVLELDINLFQAESRIAAAESRLRTAQAVHRQAEQSEAAGSASKLDLARTAQQVFAERANLTQATRDRDVVRAILLQTIGIEQDARIEFAAPELANFEERLRSVDAIRSGAFEERAELNALEASRRAAQFDREAAQRERLPKLAFSGDYGVLGQGPDRSLSTYTLGGSLTIPLFTGGRIRANVDAAQSKVAQAEAELRKTRLRVSEEVERAAIESDASRETLSAASSATNEARKALELSRLRFRAGISTSVDVATAESALAQSEDFEIRTRYDWYLAEARLARAEGNVYWFFDRGAR
ncbi:MAG: TolC family protein [Bryobacteraceae bacterium]